MTREKLEAYLREKGFRMEVTVDTESPGYCGHPIALGQVIEFLEDEYLDDRLDA